VTSTALVSIAQALPRGPAWHLDTRLEAREAQDKAREDHPMHVVKSVIPAAAMLAFAMQAGVARAEVKTQWIDYKQGDTALQGYLAYDDSKTGKRPAILLAHDRSGMSAVTIRDAEMFAKLGYVVFAEDIYGKEVRPKTVPEMQEQSTFYNKDRPLMRARAQAGLDVLSHNSMVDPAKITVIGYCFGGTVAVELIETGAPLASTVSVHGSFRNFAPENAKNIKGPVLILQGAEDETAPLPEVNKLIADLRAAKVSWQLELYSGASHAFTDPKNEAEQRADREYKVTTARFLKETIGP
jgi:dienelactone hydrolase